MDTNLSGLTHAPMPRIRRADRRRRATLLCIGFLAAIVVAQEPELPPFTFDKPAFLAGPDISNPLTGATYAYTARASAKHMQLLITVMPADEVREHLGAMSDIQCINLFLDEIKHSHQRFFVVNMAQPLIVGPAEFLRFRWTGDKSKKTMTGVLSCGTLDGFYYVIHFVDELKSATHSFPAIRTSLKSLTLKPN